jgi:hypothetical protein
MVHRRLALASLVTAIAVGVPGAAFATPSDTEYGEPLAEEPEQGAVIGQADAEGDGSLPFTGFALVPIIGAGVGAVALGLALRRRAGRD